MEYFSPKVRKGIESKSKTISRRGFVLSIAKVSFFGIIFSRLVYLQLFKSKEFKQLSDRNRYREIKEVPERGTIFDFKQRVIASNNQVYQLSIFPKEIFRASERWVKERYQNLVYYNRLNEGGHFAALEKPKDFVSELRLAFSKM